MSGLSDIEPIELGSFPLAVYGAMFGATIAGQFLGMVIDSAVLGRHLVWVPMACSVVLEAVVGERFGASRVGHSLTLSDRGRLSGYYSVCLGALTIPLLMWTAASRKPDAPFGGHDPVVAVGLCVALLAVLTVLRAALMTLFGRRVGR
jgi:hypothetical protein